MIVDGFGTLQDNRDSLEDDVSREGRLHRVRQTKAGLHVQDESIEIDGGLDISAKLRILMDLLHKHLLIRQHTLNMRFNHLRLFTRTTDTCLQYIPPIYSTHSISQLDLLLTQLAVNRKCLIFYLGRRNPILSILELKDIHVGIPHCAIMMNHKVLQSLDELTLDISCIGSIGHAKTIRKREVEC